MPILDLKTVAVIGLVLHTALALVMLQTYLTRKIYPGFRSWTIGIACWVLASGAFFSRSVIGDTMTVLLGNLLLYLFGILMHSGLMRFYAMENRKRRLAVDVAVACAGLCVVYWNFFTWQNSNLRVFVNSLVTGFLLLRAGIAPLLIARARHNLVQLGISLSFGVIAGLLFVRAAMAVIDAPYPSMQLQDPLLKPLLLLGLFGVVIAVYGFISLMHIRLEEELRDAQSRLREIADTDPLTGLLNRRGFTEMAAHDVRMARRYGHRMSLIIFDLDHFKSINDTHGHAVGDAVLAAVGGVCLGAMREVDTVARWGGEEFAVLLPQTGLEDARLSAERLRGLLRSLRPMPGTDIMTTASFGVAEMGSEGFEELVARADQCLYRAKREGRDRVCVAAG
ncbi:GGDEF domain-containing protein [Fundidesulfovibrio terrae]|uniref:GGDEF domain-containing protein n=1 Tax=Fundidesulfovibrio terrae TaxID=2922866 RepID=UPI001FAFF58F|nr:GGDEF domain-containing protein [Fundidesulfovibrio terrae]